MKMRKSAYGLAAWILSTALFASAPALAEGETEPPTSSSVTSLDSGAFQLNYPYWAPAGRGAPKALVAKYTWGGKNVRSTTAKLEKHNSSEKTAWRWILTFPDQPDPDEVAQVELLWQFEVSAEQRAQIQKATRAVVQQTLAAAKEAAADSVKFESKTATILESGDAKTLRQFGDSQGNDGMSLVRRGLGLDPGAKEGWKLTASARDRLVELANASVPLPSSPAERFAKDLKARTPGESESACKAAVPSSTTPKNVGEAGSMLDACASTLADIVEKNEGKSRADTLREAVKARVKPADELDYPFADLKDIKAAFDSYSYAASQLANHTLASSAQSKEEGDAVEALVKDISADIERTSRSEPGKVLVEGGTAPRRYDIATGAIFVSGIQDVVVPMFISVCAWDGCLKPNEVFWSAKNGLGRAFSLDAGIRVKTIDTQDPRQSDKLSFALGLSFNPVTVLRVSGGLYAFENAQSSKWNSQLYAGVTLNVLNAAELLGGLGLGSQLEPHTVEK